VGQWVGAQGRPKVANISKTCPLCDVTSREPPTETKTFFFDFDYETCWIRRGFAQLSSSIAWRGIGLQSSARNVAYTGLKWWNNVDLSCYVNDFPCHLARHNLDALSFSENDPERITFSRLKENGTITILAASIFQYWRSESQPPFPMRTIQWSIRFSWSKRCHSHTISAQAMAYVTNPSKIFPQG